jgi:hypothetical protein
MMSAVAEGMTETLAWRCELDGDTDALLVLSHLLGDVLTNLLQRETEWVDLGGQR